MGAIAFLELPESVTSAFWMGLLVLVGAYIVSTRAAVFLAGASILAIGIAFGAAAISTEDTADSVVSIALHRVVFLAAITAVADGAWGVSRRTSQSCVLDL